MPLEEVVSVWVELAEDREHGAIVVLGHLDVRTSELANRDELSFPAHCFNLEHGWNLCLANLGKLGEVDKTMLIRVGKAHNQRDLERCEH